MTPQQKIKRELMMDAIINNDTIDWLENSDRDGDGDVNFDEETIDRLWKEFEGCGAASEYANNFRDFGIETNIPSEFSRNYETKSLAAQMVDGSWVGWTYYYGGGKHGNPESIPWIEHAYDLSCVESQKTVTVREFVKNDSETGYSYS